MDEFLLQRGEEGTRPQPRLANQGRAQNRGLRVHRSVLQPPRRHSTLGMLSPADYEDSTLSTPRADLAASRLASTDKIKFTAPTITQSICNGQTYDGHGSSGTYIDTLVATNGCDSIRTLQLTVLSKSFTIAQSICNGQTYDGHGISGTYIDTLVAANGCDSIRTLQLTVLPKPAPYLGADTTLCTGKSIQLYPGQFITYTWQDGSAQNHFTVTQPGLYSVIVSDSCGSGSDEIIIKEGICDNYFPSAFTPNNDGKNDLFKILGAQNLKDYHLAVYNRYGQKVFETNDYTKGWTGIVNGQVQIPVSLFGIVILKNQVVKKIL